MWFMRRRGSGGRGERGVTLLEMVVTIGILLILASVTVPTARFAVKRQKELELRRSLRDMFAELEKDYPNLKQTMLTAMGNVQPDRLLDPRFSHDGNPAVAPTEELLPILS